MQPRCLYCGDNWCTCLRPRGTLARLLSRPQVPATRQSQPESPVTTQDLLQVVAAGDRLLQRSVHVANHFQAELLSRAAVAERNSSGVAAYGASRSRSPFREPEPNLAPSGPPVPPALTGPKPPFWTPPPSPPPLVSEVPGRHDLLHLSLRPCPHQVRVQLLPVAPSCLARGYRLSWSRILETSPPPKTPQQSQSVLIQDPLVHSGGDPLDWLGPEPTPTGTPQPLAPAPVPSPRTPSSPKPHKTAPPLFAGDPVGAAQALVVPNALPAPPGWCTSPASGPDPDWYPTRPVGGS